MHKNPEKQKSEADNSGSNISTIDAEKLFGSAREIKLQFQQEEYRLRITRNSKLILTK